ncbi:MAG: TatD family hydrolase [Oscillospiraceae bacterium]|nr:TatD family hydrolase [Oscillospiraceae bacterium]
MIFDTHAHYDDKRFDPDREQVLSALPERGVGLVLNPGCNGESSRSAIALAERYPHVWAAVGWHPEDWASWDKASMDTLRALCTHPRVAAIGEIGLDYYWDKERKSLMREMFERQLNLALQRDLPVIVHDREAHEDSLAMVENYPGLRGVFHCYSGSPEMAERLLALGWYLGFDGPVTYKNNKKAAAVLSVTPPDRILVETDSPYLSPEPLRGRRNDSGSLPYVIRRLAELKGVSEEEMERLTWENGRRLFRIGDA